MLKDWHALFCSEIGCIGVMVDIPSSTKEISYEQDGPVCIRYLCHQQINVIRLCYPIPYRYILRTSSEGSNRLSNSLM